MKKTPYVSDEERAASFKEALETGTVVEWLRDPENHKFISAWVAAAKRAV